MLQCVRMDMATKIRVARRAKGLSQRALGKVIGVSGGAVAQWETSVTLPSLDNRVDLSRQLGIPFIELLPEADKAPAESISDPQTVLLVRTFEALPAKVREVLLMQALMLLETLGTTKPAPGPDKP